ncbi:MAG: hypothetical protein R2751_09910 [Bacteroidales bacterium]
MEISNRSQQDLSLIRDMMERSSRFLSLSGWSGICAGSFALAGAALAAYILKTVPASQVGTWLVADALVVLALAMASGIYFSWRKAKRTKHKLWTAVTRRLLVFMLLPLLTGGLYSILLISQGRQDLVAGVTLIFYGFALIGAGHFTNREAVLLGIAEVILGLLATVWMDQSLWFWATGFGLFHILYGVVLFYRYDRQPQDTNRG